LSLGVIAVWHLAVASFVNGIAWASDQPVRRMMIGDAVGADRIGSGLSIDAATNNATRVLGPMLSGVLLAEYGITSVFWTSLALYAPALAAALRIGMRKHAAHARTVSFVTSIRESIGWLKRDLSVTGVLVMTVVFNVFGWPALSMVPVIGTDYLELGPKGVGLLAASDGIGGLLGALLIATAARTAWYGRIFVGGVALYLLMLMLFACAPVVPAAAAALFLAGAFNAGFAVMQSTLVYRSAPTEMRARLLGLVSVCIGTAPIGFLYLGVLAELFSPRTATVALTAQGLLAILLTRRYWLPTLRL
jgi:MFS family permease